VPTSACSLHPPTHFPGWFGHFQEAARGSLRQPFHPPWRETPFPQFLSHFPFAAPFSYHPARFPGLQGAPMRKHAAQREVATLGSGDTRSRSAKGANRDPAAGQGEPGSRRGPSFLCFAAPSPVVAKKHRSCNETPFPPQPHAPPHTNALQPRCAPPRPPSPPTGQGNVHRGVSPRNRPLSESFFPGAPPCRPPCPDGPRSPQHTKVPLRLTAARPGSKIPKLEVAWGRIRPAYGNRRGVRMGAVSLRPAPIAIGQSKRNYADRRGVMLTGTAELCGLAGQLNHPFGP
jgi:hypothetical protein